MAQFDFVGPCYTGRHREVAFEECMNLYVETAETQGKKVKWALVGTPGTKVAFPSFSGTGVVRGMYVSESLGNFYVVCGKTLYKMPQSEADSPVAIGDITDGSSHVDMVDDGRYLSIVDGKALYVHDMSDTYSGITTPLTDQMPTHVAFLGGYTLINNTYRDPAVLFPPTDNIVYYSNLYDATKWYSTSDTTSYDYFTAEGNADPVLAMKRVGDNIWLMGSKSYEVHQLSGNDKNPFTRVGGSFSDIGVAAKYSPAVIGTDLFWLGQTSHGGLCVYQSQGYDAVRVSTHAVEQDIAAVDFSDAVGWSYQEEGHDFYVLTMRGSALTYVYDASEKAWHKRSSRVTGTDQTTIWEPVYAISRGTTTYCGSNLNNKVLKLSLDAYTEWDGRLIKRIRSGPILWDDLRPIRHNRLLIDMATGVGTLQPTDVGYDPQVMMRFSDDSTSWSNEYWSPMGLRGHRQTVVMFNRLGCAKNRIYEITITAPVRVLILGASIISDSGVRN